MNETQDRVVKMEQDASRLVDELIGLKREVGSYKTATTELEKVRTSLDAFVGATQGLASETYKLIQTTNTIGGAKIIEAIEALRSGLEERAKADASRRMLIVGLLCAGIVLQIVILIMCRK